MQFPISVQSIVTLAVSCTVSEIRPLFIGRKIAKIARSNEPHSQKSLSLGVTPCEFFDELYLARSLHHGAGEEIMTLALSVFIIISIIIQTRTADITVKTVLIQYRM